MIKTGLVGNGYWGKILKTKLVKISNLFFEQNSTTYNPEQFKFVNWVFIATPPNTHFEIAKIAIKNNANVFLEKPFCSTVLEAYSLFNLAAEYNVKLYIDNVFLFRSELGKLPPFNYKKIKFIWHKFGPFNDLLINDLLYHDLYILYHCIGENQISNLKLNTNKKNELHFSFEYGKTKVIIDYNRSIEKQKVKKIIADDITINFKSTIEDPLYSMMYNCINDKIDFISNNVMNLKVKNIFENINSQLITK
jgi:hypothetical protein